jgi:fumarate reductase subunit D
MFHEIRLGCVLTVIIALPIVLAHTEQIRVEAMVMSIVGGLLIYGTIISFTMFFREQEEF